MNRKGITTALLVLALGVANAMAEETRPKEDGKNVREHFRLKGDRALLGATLEVLTSTGHRMVVQKLKRRKVIIDFSNAMFGEYVIRITTTGSEEQEYRFLKK